uniref:Uncharacterized protein n=1 Tax=Anopheles quadriannulatus TaxID=34691 RepID=A0A182XRD4_ANOQN
METIDSCSIVLLTHFYCCEKKKNLSPTHPAPPVKK